jgi:predicted O-methyltransferase YrrM
MKKHTASVVGLIEEFAPGPKQGCEVGVWMGRTSAVLLRTFPDLVLHAVDPWDEGGDHDSMPKTAEELREGKRVFLEVTEFAADRRIVHQMTSERASALMPDGSLDFCFIDADHQYAAVLLDVGLWWPKVRPGGVICGHDYGGVGDRTGKFGVCKAVNEFAGHNNLTVGRRKGMIWFFVK